ncbi:MAG: hypothetical protein KF892_25120, partial [Rhizobacter sp.]|nr:hypothetical protein [Rhizobacter sp.]
MSINRRQASSWLLGSTLAAPATAAEPTFIMKIGSPVAGDASNEWMRRFKQGIEQRLPKQLRVELYP